MTKVKDLAPTPRAGVDSRRRPRPDWMRTPAKTLEEHSLMALVELSRELNTELDIYGVAELGLLNFMGSLGTAVSALWLQSKEDPSQVALMRSFGIRKSEAKGRLGELIPRLLEVLDKTSTPVFLDEISGDLREEDTEYLRGLGIAFFAALVAKDTAVGIVAVGPRVGGVGFEAFQLRVFQASLFHFGMALENAFLFSDLRENHRLLTQKNEEVEELDRLKLEFLDSIQHELRTPLTVILGNLEILGFSFEENSLEIDSLEMVQASATDLQTKIETLLELATATRGESELEMETVEAGSFLAEVYEVRRHGVTKDLREMSLRRPEEPVFIVADRARLTRVLDALIDNAAKFTPPGTSIVMELEPGKGDGDRPVLRVRDDGPGIAREHLSNIFDLFRQVDQSTTRQAGGLGLGLPYARALVTEMDGELRLESEEGAGTTCSIYLELDADAS